MNHEELDAINVRTLRGEYGEIATSFYPVYAAKPRPDVAVHQFHTFPALNALSSGEGPRSF